jgi:hypothetical protein
MSWTRVPRALVALSLLLLALGCLVPAQAKDEKYVWPPITPEELAMKDDPTNPGAPAILLYREQQGDDQKRYETVYYRIKVLTDEGRKYADIEIPYVERLGEIEDIRARTVRPDGSAVDFQGQVFDRMVVKSKKFKFQAKTFSLPEVQRGNIIEYSYRSHWLKDWPDVLKHPANYVIDTVLSFPTEHWTVQHELFTRHVRFSLRPLPGAQLGRVWVGLAKDRGPRVQPDGTVSLELENVPAFQEEEYMPPESAIKACVDLFYIVGSLMDAENFWGKVGNRHAEGFEKFIGDFKSVKRAVAATVQPDEHVETKLRKLYARAQQIRFLSYEPFKSDAEAKREKLEDNQNVEDVLKHGYAYANEINLLFAALARAAGLEASVVEVVARDRAFFRKQVLDESQLSAVVIRVKVGVQDYYFDPATRFCPFKFLPWEESGAQGLRVDKSNTLFVTTPQPESKDAVIERKAVLQLDSEGALQGKVQVSFSGQEALRRRIENREKDEAGRRKELEDEMKGWLPAEAAVELKSASNWEGSEESLFAEFAVKVQNLAAFTGHRLLLPPAVFQANRTYPFQNAKRVHAVYFSYPSQVVDEVSIQLPAGYRVESLPAARTKTAPFGSYAATYEEQGGALRFNRRLVMEGYFIPLQQYSALRLFYDNVRAGDEQQVVLKAEEAAPKN